MRWIVWNTQEKGKHIIRLNKHKVQCYSSTYAQSMVIYICTLHFSYAPLLWSINLNRINSAESSKPIKEQLESMPLWMVVVGVYFPTGKPAIFSLVTIKSLGDTIYKHQCITEYIKTLGFGKLTDLYISNNALSFWLLSDVEVLLSILFLGFWS